METLIKERRSISNISERYFKETGQTVVEEEIIYPDDNGEPMSENTEQFNWIVKIKENLEGMYVNDPFVFVAGDLLWYPIKGNNEIRRAPDVMVAFGRPKGRRGSYRTWDEEGIVPQVVFEILSPGNTPFEMAEKFNFYDTYGVEEYYLYDPDKIILKGWNRTGIRLRPIENMDGWVSPRLKIRFDMSGEELELFRPDGQIFLSPVEVEIQSKLNLQKAEAAEKRVKEECLKTEEERLKVESERQRAEAADKRVEEEQQRAEAERQRAEAAVKRAEAERQKAEADRQKAEEEHQRAERLAAILKKIGIDSDKI